MSKRTFNLSFDLADQKANIAYKHLCGIPMRKKSAYIIDLLCAAATNSKEPRREVVVDASEIAEVIIERLRQDGLVINENEDYAENEFDDDFDPLEEMSIFK